MNSSFWFYVKIKLSRVERGRALCFRKWSFALLLQFMREREAWFTAIYSMRKLDGKYSYFNSYYFSSGTIVSVALTILSGGTVPRTEVSG